MTKLFQPSYITIYKIFSKIRSKKPKEHSKRFWKIKIITVCDTDDARLFIFGSGLFHQEHDICLAVALWKRMSKTKDLTNYGAFWREKNVKSHAAAVLYSWFLGENVAP